MRQSPFQNLLDGVIAFIILLVVGGYIVNQYFDFEKTISFALLVFLGFLAYRAYLLFIAGYFDMHEMAARLNRHARQQQKVILDGKTGLPITQVPVIQDPFRLNYERVEVPPFGGDEIDHARFKDQALLISR